VAILAGIVRFFRDILQAKLWLKEKAKDRRMIFKELRPKIKEKFRGLYARKYEELFFLVDTISMKDLNHFLLSLQEIDLKYKTSSISTKSNSHQTLLESFLFDYCCRRKNLKKLSYGSAQY
ncbi:MAG: DNA polymerase III subunit delta, partial [Acidobacteriota bacterium]|nr:DNA polymerase III subunit delta [Acidobacteriota bacterium]